MLVAVLAAPSAWAQAQLFETKAKQAFMIDAETGTVLYSKDPDAPFPPASLAKLMTMEVVFNAIRTGKLSLDTEFPVSEYAWRTGGAPSRTSTMFAALNSLIRVEDLIQGVIVQSANDGCIILAEGMAGSEANFAELMNERARELGLTKSVFRNSTGLPAEGQSVTARELVALATHLWREYPEFYKHYSQPDFTWNKIFQRNRNPLLALNIGADGLATGFTEASGFAIVGSAARDGRRVFIAMSGMESDAQRAEEARRLIEWGMRGFDRLEIYAAGEVVGEAKAYGGEKSGVALRAAGPVAIFVPVANRDRLVARIVYQGPVVAPVEEGTPIGALKVWIGDTMSQETPLYAAESVGTGKIHQRALDAVEELLIGWLR
ncbi:MAG: D-alanyl-D-alanine carboxypeptidase [Aquamicrobium sp.]|uniref:D-alanyl-D-alanine carboxypeptidase family protein n=1 Tax=Aquamicrobium sp. TaxID=1872579 RepID=UPI00349EED36|nr:D-alanyl-D-alanine carboxypeptidase [Aquamicrobium sp.]